MKKIKNTGTLILICSVIFISSCKKENTSPLIILQDDIASMVAGNYIGSGTSANGDAFIEKTIKITKVDNHRIKVEPVGHTYITPFEIKIWACMGNIISDPDQDSISLAIVLHGPVGTTIGFSTETSGMPEDQDFGGFKE